MNQTIKLSLNRGVNLFLAVLLIATIAPQILSIKTAFAGDGYLWDNAATVNQATYDWGYYPTCPASDSTCMDITGTLNGHTYGEADLWDYNLRNCTSYVAYKIAQMFTVDISGWGDAKDWDGNATGPGHPYTNDTTPKVGDIAQWTTGGAGHGHVAYVGAVNPTTHVATYWEYNYAGTGAFTNTYTSASNSQGAPSNYIHIDDLDGTDPPPAYASSTPTNVVKSTGAEDIFEIAQNNHLYEKSYNPDTGWGGWGDKGDAGVGFKGSAVATINSSDTIDVFAWGADHNLWQIEATTGWGSWTNLGSPSGGGIDHSPSLVHKSDDTIDVYSTANNYVWHITRSSGTWGGWLNLGTASTGLNGVPGLILELSGATDVFVYTTGAGMYSDTWTPGSGWSGWSSRGTTGGGLTGVPETIQASSGNLDVYAVASDGHVWEKVKNTSGWQAWTDLGEGTSSGHTDSPATTLLSDGTEDVFAVTTTGGLWNRTWTSSGGWNSWASRGTPGDDVNSTPTTFVSASGYIHVFIVSANGHMWEKYKAPGGGWSGWGDQGTVTGGF